MKEIMKWELKNLLRFPILEIIIVFAVFQIGVIGYINIIPSGGLSIHSFHLEIGKVTYGMITENLINSKIIIYFITSLLFTISFAYELDTNLTKIYMSYPVKRRDYFISKFAGCFAVIFLTFLSAGIGFAVFIDGSYASINIVSPFILVYMLTLFLLLFFASSVATTVAVFSKNTALSFIGTFFVLYIFDSIATNIKLSPSYFLDNIWNQFFTGLATCHEGQIVYHISYTEVIKTIYPPLFLSSVLFFISFVYYTKYFEVK